MHGGQVAGELVGVSGVLSTTCATYGIPRLCDQLPANVYRYWASCQALENKNLSQVSNLLSQNLKYYNHPRPSSGGLDKDKLLAFLSNLTFIERWDFGYKNPISFVENEKENELVLHFSAVTYATWGQTYDPEFIWFIHFDKEGKIDGLKEFFDNLYRQTILADVKAKAESA